MPRYEVRYKTQSDPDGRSWDVGLFPDRDYALHVFNTGDARKAGLGPFTFEETSPFPSDYCLVEQNDPKSLELEVLFRLYIKT